MVEGMGDGFGEDLSCRVEDVVTKGFFDFSFFIRVGLKDGGFSVCFRFRQCQHQFVRQPLSEPHGAFKNIGELNSTHRTSG